MLLAYVDRMVSAWSSLAQVVFNGIEFFCFHHAEPDLLWWEGGPLEAAPDGPNSEDRVPSSERKTQIPF